VIATRQACRAACPGSTRSCPESSSCGTVGPLACTPRALGRASPPARGGLRVHRSGGWASTAPRARAPRVTIVSLDPPAMRRPATWCPASAPNCSASTACSFTSAGGWPRWLGHDRLSRAVVLDDWQPAWTRSSRWWPSAPAPQTSWLEGSGLLLDDGVVCDEMLLRALGAEDRGWPPATSRAWPNPGLRLRADARRALDQRRRAGAAGGGPARFLHGSGPDTVYAPVPQLLVRPLQARGSQSVWASRRSPTTWRSWTGHSRSAASPPPWPAPTAASSARSRTACRGPCSSYRIRARPQRAKRAGDRQGGRREPGDREPRQLPYGRPSTARPLAGDGDRVRGRADRVDRLDRGRLGR